MKKKLTVQGVSYNQDKDSTFLILVHKTVTTDQLGLPLVSTQQYGIRYTGDHTDVEAIQPGTEHELDLTKYSQKPTIDRKTREVIPGGTIWLEDAEGK
jgi:hypothetical protein